MLECKALKITYFKNHTFSNFNFTKPVIGIVGKNGVGKTNLLDAIYYLCFTKSYLNTDGQCIHNGENGFRIEADFVSKTIENNLVLIHKNGQRKDIKINEIAYEKLAEHLGKFPCVFITPDDIALINEGSELRRKYIDAMACQLNFDYTQALIKYNKIILERNSLLKHENINYTILEIYDNQLLPLANYIFEERKKLCNKLLPIVGSNYLKLANNNDGISIEYKSQLHDIDFDDLLLQNRQKDIASQRTNGGIHKDDLEITMNGVAIKSIASQGQKKSLLFALKSAEHKILFSIKNQSPILLLDDVFEKLDGDRLKNLLLILTQQEPTQIFITDTDASRLTNAFTQLNLLHEIIELKLFF